MSPADRRRAILAAVIPLLIKKGAAVTTAEMAQAAGIAEGTIFRVFPDKSALIGEALKATIDPDSVNDAVQAIDPSVSLDTKLTLAAQALLDHFRNVIALAELLRSMPTPTSARHSEGRRMIAESSEVISQVLTTLLEPHSKELRVAPAKASAALRGLIFASGHPLIPPDERLTIDEIVAILLAGILRPKAPE
jgi:AcrR family transcriptional regulator